MGCLFLTDIHPNRPGACPLPSVSSANDKSGLFCQHSILRHNLCVNDASCPHPLHKCCSYGCNRNCTMVRLVTYALLPNLCCRYGAFCVNLLVLPPEYLSYNPIIVIVFMLFHCTFQPIFSDAVPPLPPRVSLKRVGNIPDVVQISWEGNYANFSIFHGPLVFILQMRFWTYEHPNDPSSWQTVLMVSRIIFKIVLRLKACTGSVPSKLTGVRKIWLFILRNAK